MTLGYVYFLGELVVVSVVLFLTIYFYFNNSYKYWKSKGIPTLPVTFPFGHLGPVLAGKVPIGDLTENLYNVLGKMNKFSGFYTFNKPNLMINDPEQIKNILVKDFDHFHDRSFYYNEKDDPISAHLFAIEGQKWRDLRMKLTPTFTSGKLKVMFPTILKLSEQLQSFLEDAVSKDKTIDIKDVFAKFATDVVGSCAFGIDCNSLKDPDAEFRKTGQLIFKKSYAHNLMLMFITTYTNVGRFLRIKVNKEEVSNFFTKMVKETIRHREDNNIKRKDFMDLMIQLKNNGRMHGDDSEEQILKDTKITEDQVIAQTFLFFLASFETSSSVMSFCLYELAINPEIQESARQEVKSLLDKFEGKMTYEALAQLPYLDTVIYETIRKYPPLPHLTRTCTKDYTLPNTDITISKGTPVFISVRGIHHDPQYYPKPDIFDPDRFTAENKAKRHPFAFLGFGEGPRHCVGLRFGMLQTRLGIITALLNFKIEISEKTPIPLKLDPNNFLSIPLGGVWLNMSRIG